MGNLILCYLYYNISKLNNIVAIIKLILLLISHGNEYDMISAEAYAIVIFLSLAFPLVFHLFFYRIVKSLEEIGKKDTIYKLSKSYKWVSAVSSNLNVGDIVKIGIKNTCPADILILDSTEHRMNGKVVLVNEKKITGINTINRKWPISDKLFDGTESQTNEIKNVLNGSIEYLDPIEQFGDRIGSLKLKGDPKPRIITQDNLLFTGSTLYTAS
jgi:magnesium-transporting ATPase (P-type)